MMYGYDSFSASERRTQTPVSIVDTQNTHRHPFAGVRYAPIMGPIEGARIGPIAHPAMAAARFSGAIMSAIEPAPIVIEHEPAMAANNRNVTNAPRLLATAQATLKMKKSMAQTWYVMLRP
jgi:hypothetical protein